MNLAGQIFPWVAILGFFGLLLKVRVTGDPALWRRIEALEKRLDEQAAHFDDLLERERKDCAAKLAQLEGKIRQMRQREQSFGNVVEDRPLSEALHAAFPVQLVTDQDADLLKKLDTPTRRKRVRK